MFKPTNQQIETIAELSHARAPITTIARELHIMAHDFIEWRKAMMAATAAAEESARWQRPDPAPVAKPVFK
jgi:hypothetical protein